MYNNSIMHTKRLIIMYRVITVRLKYDCIIMLIVVFNALFVIVTQHYNIAITEAVNTVERREYDKTTILQKFVHAVTIYFTYYDVLVSVLFSHEFNEHGYVVLLCYPIYQ